MFMCNISSPRPRAIFLKGFLLSYKSLEPKCLAHGSMPKAWGEWLGECPLPYCFTEIHMLVPVMSDQARERRGWNPFHALLTRRVPNGMPWKGYVLLKYPNLGIAPTVAVPQKTLDIQKTLSAQGTSVPKGLYLWQRSLCGGKIWLWLYCLEIVTSCPEPVSHLPPQCSSDVADSLHLYKSGSSDCSRLP